jgi:hypothetical protein
MNSDFASFARCGNNSDNSHNNSFVVWEKNDMISWYFFCGLGKFNMDLMVFLLWCGKIMIYDVMTFMK